MYALCFARKKELELLFDSSSNVVKFVLKARYDGNSELVAELVTANGFKAAYAVKDGAEGPRGWMVFSVLNLIIIINLAIASFETDCNFAE